MNKQAIEQPPTYVPPPQHYLPPPLPSPHTITPEAQQRQAGRKFKVAFFATIAFVVLSNTVTYRIMNQIFLAFTGKTNEVVSEAGFPTSKGIFLHACVFFIGALVIFKGL